MNLARNMKSNKNGFFKYISSKGKTVENVVLLMNRAEPVTKDTEEDEMLDCHFCPSL